MDRDSEKPPVYTVGISGNSALLKINGRAVYTNCAPVGDFFSKCKKSKIIVDFKQCQGMDSTFMGILAGAAMETRKKKDAESILILINLSERNVELVKNLGLHLICDVDINCNTGINGNNLQMNDLVNDKSGASKDVILQAHETLAGLNAKNAKAFQEVLTYMRQKAEDERPLE